MSQYIKSSFLVLMFTFACAMLVSIPEQVWAMGSYGSTSTPPKPDYDPNSSPHGNYTSNTNTCATCHSTHTGVSDQLLRTSTRQAGCYVCHDGRGSKYDSKNGLTYTNLDETDLITTEDGRREINPQTTTSESISGGFGPLVGDTSETNHFTSKHKIEDANLPPGGTEQFLLVCTTCHNPHATDNHRSIPLVVNGKYIGNPIQYSHLPKNQGDLDLEGNESYGEEFFSDKGIEATVSVDHYSGREIVSYKTNMDLLCTACHLNYSNKTNHTIHYSSILLPGSYSPTLPADFTTLPTSGVPSGAFPLPSSTVAEGGSLAAGTYYYVVTSINGLGESSKGFEKRMVIGEDTQKTAKLVFAPISNATDYNVYRALDADPLDSTPPVYPDDYTLIGSTRDTTIMDQVEIETGTKANFRYLDVDPDVNIIDMKFEYTDNGTSPPPDLTTMNNLLKNEFNWLDNSKYITVKPPGVNLVDKSPEQQLNAAEVQCVSCHFAHGTKVANTEGKVTTNLLRQTFNSLCTECHK